jgi:uncharacterized membrane protein
VILLFWVLGMIFVGLAVPLIRRKVRPNALYGLRVAETLENEEVWFEANARSGRDLLWVGIGTIVVPSALYALPWRDDKHYALVCCGLLIIAVIVYAVRGLRTARAVKQEIAGAVERRRDGSREF